MIIRNKTLYNKELIMKYNKFYLTSYIKRNFLIISAISTVFIIYMLVKKEWVYAAVLFGILLFYLALTFLMQSVTTKRILKRSPLVEQPVLQTYEFRDADFDVVNIKTYVVNYSEIIKVKKAKEFYLFSAKNRKTYIITFDGFDSENDRAKFEAFINVKFNKRKG